MDKDVFVEKNSLRVWLFDTKDADEEELIKKYSCYFSKKRLETIERCKNSRARRLSVCAGVLLYKVLSEYEIDTREFDYGENGKPYAKNNKDIFFNLSHSGCFVMLAVAGSEVGADIQKPVSDNGSLLKKISKEEPPKGETLNFVWALKESYTKLLGIGILKEFSDITFRRGKDLIEVSDKGEKAAFASEIPIGDGYRAVVSMKEPFETVSCRYFGPKGQKE